MALIRYPGSKEKLAPEIIEMFPDEMKHELWASAARWEYREPFFGAGAVGFRVLRVLPKTSRVWLNDIDFGLTSLWQSVLITPRELCDLISKFKPHQDHFYDFKENDGKPGHDPLVIGFRKLALHQMSVSGFGVKSGGPLGGKHQNNSKYSVDCRWNPERLKSHVWYLHRILRKFRNIQITTKDYSELLKSAPRRCFIYIDPPYVKQGKNLYKFHLKDTQHERLSALVQGLRCDWVLSYDDEPLVRQLYSWASIKEVFLTYTNATNAKGSRPKNREVVISPKTRAAESVA